MESSAREEPLWAGRAMRPLCHPQLQKRGTAFGSPPFLDLQCGPAGPGSRPRPRPAAAGPGFWSNIYSGDSRSNTCRPLPGSGPFHPTPHGSPAPKCVSSPSDLVRRAGGFPGKPGRSCGHSSSPYQLLSKRCLCWIVPESAGPVFSFSKNRLRGRAEASPGSKKSGQSVCSARTRVSVF